MSISRRLLTIVACLALNACSEHEEWREEVRLPDGRVLLVDRDVKIDVGLDGRRHAPAVYSMRASNPATGERIRWRGEFGMSLVLLGFDGPNAYLVIFPNRCGADMKKYGSPNPPYVALEHKQGEWVRIPLAELPKSISRANLSGRYSRDLIKNGLLTSASVEKINHALEFTTAGDFQREIPRDFESWTSKYKDQNGDEPCR